MPPNSAAMTRHELGFPSTPPTVLRPNYKFFCPICMWHFKHLLKTTCCASQYICHSCLHDLAATARQQSLSRSSKGKSRTTVLSCPFCMQDLRTAEVTDEEEVREYFDSPRRNCGLGRVRSPPRTDDTFEKLARKLSLFEADGYRATVPDLDLHRSVRSAPAASPGSIGNRQAAVDRWYGLRELARDIGWSPVRGSAPHEIDIQSGLEPQELADLLMGSPPPVDLVDRQREDVLARPPGATSSPLNPQRPSMPHGEREILGSWAIDRMPSVEAPGWGAPVPAFHDALRQRPSTVPSVHRPRLHEHPSPSLPRHGNQRRRDAAEEIHEEEKEEDVAPPVPFLHHTSMDEDGLMGCCAPHSAGLTSRACIIL
eukprot:NODE_1899_length_1363_cov_39.305175_g1719_i0.p1 GENE.NODE_1899_length_1363_cov_39.305175_g1719_i0~~NODE_1899_length_1363_cov_39.305175_g1719_i0.p1  ORF type:complete len:370 (-),score=43.90 NODE_1899_length_1363_cov_39.305175_g1719_i0:179-1288(-)